MSVEKSVSKEPGWANDGRARPKPCRKIALKQTLQSSVTVCASTKLTRNTGRIISMSKDSERESSPLTFDLKKDLHEKIHDLRRVHGAASKSEIIRHAISVFDYTSYEPENRDHLQISVRLPVKQRDMLVRIAKKKDVSVGELLRVALEGLPVTPAGLGTKKQTASVVPMAKKATKKVAKKAAKKKGKK